MTIVPRTYAFDIETLINCFTVTFLNCHSDDYHQFVIHSNGLINDSEALVNFISSVGDEDTFVGFNSIGFDMPILKVVLTLSASIGSSEPKYVVRRAYEMAQSIVSDKDAYVKGDYNAFKLSQKHIDLFKLYHFDNEAKRTSLKWIQCHLNMDNVQEMPHEHDKIVETVDQIDMILGYNYNDVLATKALYNDAKTENLIKLREWAINRYNLNIGINTSNSHMGESIFLSNLGDIPLPDSTPRIINIKDLILPEIKFKTKTFDEVLEKFKAMSFKSTDEKPATAFYKVFRGMKYSFGLGGLHAAMEESSHTNVTSIDVKSFYPNIAISYGFHPKHAGEKFVEVYKELYEERLKAKTKVADAGIKEALNSVFGKSNSKFSKLYYPEFTYSITINGQLLMLMLAESIEYYDVGTVIMINTDGMEVVVSDEEKFDMLLEDWKSKTRMTVSRSSYEKLYIRDVNNYFGIISGGKTKTKGIYEVNKDFHKDPSAKIMAIAISNYYVHGFDIKHTIEHHKNIDDFFLFKRAKTGKFVGVPSNGSTEYPLPKTIRYLATKEGFILYQVTDSMKSKVHSDCYITVMNDKDVIEHIDINKEWYYKETLKLLIKESLTLF